VGARTVKVELFGRDPECVAIDDLLERAKAGRGGALLLRGEAGVGKTVLLEYALAVAREHEVLVARGVESEAEIAFSGLSDLLRPVLDQLSVIPERQSAALAGALAIGPPATADRFAVAAATLSLLAAAAERRPLLVVVDDVHWVDTASAEALLFAARRLDAEAVAMLFAVRDDEAAPFGSAGIPQLALEGLDRAASLALLSSRMPDQLSTTVADRLFRATGGNPLALVEIPPLLSGGQLAGSEELDEPLPTGSNLERGFASRIARLSHDARSALLVAAASDSEEVGIVLGALEHLATPEAALEEAERAGLISIRGDQLRFRHPLLRSCAYHGAAGPDRRAAHRALAAALAAAANGEGGDRRAWHLASATMGPDEDVAQLLERAGDHARRRQGFAAAASAFERAAHLSPGRASRAKRLLAAADASQLANRVPRAVALLEAADAAAGESELRVEIRHLRGRIETWRGHADEAVRLLVAEADALAGKAPHKAVTLLTEAVSAAIVGPGVDAAAELAERAYELAEPLGGRHEHLAALQLGKVLILAGQAGRGYPLLMRCVSLLEDEDPLSHGVELAQCAPALMAVEEYAVAARVLEHVIDAARPANALGLLPYCLGARAELETRIGRWTSAFADAFESVHLAREAGQEAQLLYNLGRLAVVEAGWGREEACRAHAEEARELAAGGPSVSHLSFAEGAVGLLELGLGRPEAAIPALEAGQDMLERMRMQEPGRFDCIADLVEAYVRSGRRDEAERALVTLESRAQRTGRICALATSSRCRGLLTSKEDVDDPFRTALVLHERTTVPFERARTELCYGEVLRRHGRRVDARAQLRAALTTFERLGAEPWAARARAELAATGERLRSKEARLTDELTSQELQVALIVATGATNKEAAAALFLTPKTIEFHLGKIYRKLGVRSRTALARRLGEDGAIAQSAPA
jgi:DNA-binding CsgD family transcriptional regulator